MGLCCWCCSSKDKGATQEYPYSSHRLNNNLQTFITDSVPCENTNFEEEYIKRRKEKKQQQNSTNSKEIKQLTKFSNY